MHGDAERSAPAAHPGHIGAAPSSHERAAIPAGFPRLTDAASLYLDALRAVASNLVVVAHVLLIWYPGQYVYRGGTLAVVVFFLLSGFLISQSMLKASLRPGPQLPGFLADRVARIMTPFVPALLIVAMLDALLVKGHWGGEGINTGVAAFIGNLLMLQDYPVFQLLDIAHVDVWWRIRPYETGEPFWTVAIEFWLYASMGLFFFCVVMKEKARTSLVVLLALVSAPVLVWNAAAGFGESLSLLWIVGALAGLLVWRLQQAQGRDRPWGRIACCVTGLGALALAGRARKEGFDVHSMQIAVLVAVVMFGVLIALLGRQRKVAAPLAAPVRFLAGYSYSLYLIHNTVLTIVFEHTKDTNVSRPVAIFIGVIAAQVAAWLMYMAFERHYRSVAAWLRPMFAKALAVPRQARAAGGRAEGRGVDSAFVMSRAGVGNAGGAGHG